MWADKACYVDDSKLDWRGVIGIKLGYLLGCMAFKITCISEENPGANKRSASSSTRYRARPTAGGSALSM